MKPYGAAAAGVLITTVLLMTVSGLVQSHLDRPVMRQSLDEVVAEPLDQVEERIYILRACQGRVAIYAPQAQQPLEITEISIERLPETDRQALEKGVVVQGETALYQMLEDFGS